MMTQHPALPQFIFSSTTQHFRAHTHPHVLPAGNQQRQVLPEGGVKQLVRVKFNGQDTTDLLETGTTREVPGSAGVIVHFPAAKHAVDPTDGPAVVIVTPDMAVSHQGRPSHWSRSSNHH